MPLAFGVILHLATALVIIIMFRDDIIKMITGVLSPAGEGKYLLRVKADPNALFGWWIIVGSFPIVIMGMLFYDIFEVFFNSAFIVALALMGTGLVLTLSANNIKKAGKKKLSILDAYAIGLAQGLALVPGLSRSGLTIGVGLMRNIDRETAAKYSILLAVPAIIGATILETGQMIISGSYDIDLIALLVGGITAFIVGYIAIKLLLLLVRKAGFHYFAVYCFALTALILTTM
jgi:undecaprenyl-diphosphatase